MPFSRRRFVVLVTAIAQLAPFRRLFAAPIVSLAPTPSPNYRPCLDAWVNTLVPGDEHSPGAVELGVPRSLVNKGGVDRGYLELIVTGCRWLNTEASERGEQNFSKLNVADREEVASLAERSPSGSVPRTFFEHTLEDTYFYYYARPESWIMLHYDGPPQPRGFLDYAQPPRV